MKSICKNSDSSIKTISDDILSVHSSLFSYQSDLSSDISVDSESPASISGLPSVTVDIMSFVSTGYKKNKFLKEIVYSDLDIYSTNSSFTGKNYTELKCAIG